MKRKELLDNIKLITNSLVMLIVFNTPYPIIFKVKFAVIVYFYLLCKIVY